MSAAAVADAPTAPSAPRWLVVTLIFVAAVETINAITDVPGIFYRYNHPTALLDVAQALVRAKLVLAVPLAAAALVFAARGQLRIAIALLAALVIMRWALDVPTSWMVHGFELSGGLPGFVVFAQQFLYPLIGLGALALAWRNQRLGLATLLVSLSLLAGAAMIAGFAIGVAIYGF